MSLSLVTADPRGFKPPSASELLALQAEQFEHDERYHREIARLPVQNRIRHMALHFSKYLGRLLKDESDDERTLTDVFIIALSSANILGLHLDGCANAETHTATRSDFVEVLGVATGQMAAACEKLDHLEDFPFRKVLSQAVTDIAVGLITFASANGLDLGTLVRKRLSGVRSRAFVPGQPL